MVDETLYKQYTQALGTNTTLLERAITSLAQELAGLEGVKLEQALAARYAALVKQFGATAAQVAVEFYTQQRAIAGVEQQHGAYTATQADAPKDEVLFNDVARAIKAKTDTINMLKNLNGQATKRTLGQADNTLLHNALLDPAHPKWAFVPSLGACGWCIFLGSQGFVYTSQATAAKSRHAHCRCTSVVDFDTKNPSLKGYDVEKLRSHYLTCRQAIEQDANDAWAAMSEEEKAKYGTRSNGDTNNAYDHYLRNRIVQEMNTQGRE